MEKVNKDTRKTSEDQKDLTGPSPLNPGDLENVTGGTISNVIYTKTEKISENTTSKI